MYKLLLSMLLLMLGTGFALAQEPADPAKAQNDTAPATKPEVKDTAAKAETENSDNLAFRMPTWQIGVSLITLVLLILIIFQNMMLGSKVEKLQNKS